jgi:hypothetical protein
MKLTVIVPINPNDTVDFLDMVLEHIKSQTISDEVQVISDEAPHMSEFLNEKFDLVEGKYLIINELNTLWMRDGMERMLSLIEPEYPFVSVVHTNSWSRDVDGNKVKFKNKVDGLETEQITGQIEFKKEMGNTVNSAANIIKVDALERLRKLDGYIWDERLRYHEDWDLWLRLIKHRRKILFKDSEPVSNWINSPSSRHNAPLFNFYKKIIYMRIRSGYYE